MLNHGRCSMIIFLITIQLFTYSLQFEWIEIKHINQLMIFLLITRNEKL